MGTNREPHTRRAYQERVDHLEQLGRQQGVEAYEKQRALEDELDMTSDQLAETLKVLENVKAIVGTPVAYRIGFGPTAEELNDMHLGKLTKLRYQLGISTDDVEIRGAVDE